jgi:hypothetical protein
MIIDSFAAQKFEVRDFKYFTFHLRIQIGIESGTPSSIGYIPQNRVQVLFRHDDNYW